MTALVLGALIALTSCSTTTVTADYGTVLAGRVYDENGIPLSGVAFRSGRFRGISDDFGRFRIDNLPRGERHIHAYREGFERHSFTVTLQSPQHFARISLWSMEGLIDQALTCLRVGAVDAAIEVHRRCLSIDPADRRVDRLGALLEAIR